MRENIEEFPICTLRLVNSIIMEHALILLYFYYTYAIYLHFKCV